MIHLSPKDSHLRPVRRDPVRRVKLAPRPPATAYATRTKRRAARKAKMATPERIVVVVRKVKLIGKTKRKKSYRKEKVNLLKKSRACHWCGCPLDEATATLDHVIRLADGGCNDYSNYVLACAPCNNRRHDGAQPQTPPEGGEGK